MTKVKSKQIALLILGVLFSFGMYAQSIAPESITNCAATMTQSNGSLSFTVGELVVLNFSDSDGNSLGGGFTNSSTISTAVLSVKEPDAQLLDVKVFPNPTNALVYIQINRTSMEQVIVSITDSQGKELYEGQYAGMTNIIGINTAAYSSGTYVLLLKNKNNQVLGGYKIIKQ